MRSNSAQILLFFLVLFNVACKQQFEPMPEKKLTQILTEMHLAESYAKQLPQLDTIVNKKMKEDSLAIFYAQILNKYAITENEFIKNMNWYSTDAKRLDSIYQNILADLSLMQIKEE